VSGWRSRWCYLDTPLVDLAGLKVLVADDVADSGTTLALIRDLAPSPCRRTPYAVLYKKPWSVVDPDYFWAGTDGWIAFPWSSEPPVV